MVGTDKALLVRSGEGDRAALAELYDRYAGMVLALARRILGDAGAAEDVAHDVFVELWRTAGDHDGSVRARLVAGTRSRALARRISGPRLRQPSAEVAILDSLTPDRSLVQQALARLPPEERTVLELGYYEGLTSTEIAARQAVPAAVIRARLASALTTLRAELLR